MYKEEKELWVKFACAALSAIVSSGDFENNVDLDCEMASDYADQMLRLYKDKFKGC